MAASFMEVCLGVLFLAVSLLIVFVAIDWHSVCGRKDGGA